MLRENRNRRKFFFLIILFAITQFACPLSDLIPDPCSAAWLIAKINLANLTPGTYTIDLDPGCIYELDDIDNSFLYGDNGLPVISTPIVINGNNATIQRSAAEGTPEFRIFFIDSNGSLTLEDVTITNGNTGSAPDIYSSGGAILNHEGSLTIIDSAITDNFSQVHGGGIVVIRGSLTITGSTFSGNEHVDDGDAWYGGGAVAIFESAPMTITDSEFTDNLSPSPSGSSGGAIFALETSTTITGCTFTNNSNNAIAVDGSELTIIDSDFISNQGFAGGAINSSGFYFDGSIFTHNEKDITITGSTFANNQAIASGGALSIRNVANLTITKSSFINNQVTGQGGGGGGDGHGSAITLLAHGNQVPRNVHIYESSFIGNEVSGGAVIFESFNATTPELSGYNLSIKKSTFASNTGSHGPGGIWSSGDLTIENSTFSGNSGSCSVWSNGDCGSTIHSTGSVDIYYSTIVNNSGPSSNAAVFSKGGSIRISGSIIANNANSDCGSSDGGVIGSYAASLDSDGSCFSLIHANPLIDPLAYNGGPTQTHALQSSSPAIDAGGVRCPADDQRSVIRPQGAGCDLGAYEKTPYYWCEDLLGITILEDDLIRIQVSTPGLPAGIYEALAGETDFICKTYPEYPNKLFCDGPRGEPGSFANLIIYDPLGLPFCELPFGFPSRDVPDDKPEEPKGCSKYTTMAACNADPLCTWTLTTSPGGCIKK